MWIGIVAAWGRPFAVEDYDRLREVSEPAVSPDGASVVYTVTVTLPDEDRRVSSLAVAPLGGGPARPLTRGGDEHLPRFSPDGRHLAFLRPAEPDGAVDQLWLLPLAGGEARPVTELPGGVVDYDWAPDSRRLALVVADPDEQALATAEDPERPPLPVVIDRYWFLEDGTGWLTHRHQHLSLLDLTDGSVTPLTTGHADDHLPAFSPDGTRIAFASRRGADPDREDWDVWTIEARSGAEPVLLTRNPSSDQDPEWASRPRWSPDGATLALVQGGPAELSYYAGYHVVLVPADGSGEPRPLLPGLDRNTWSPAFSADGRQVWFVLEDDGDLVVGRARLDGKEPWARVTPPELVVEALEPAGDGAVLIASTPTHPAELYAIGKKDRVAPLTDENAWIGDVDLAATTRLSFASADGTEIHGFLVRPPLDGPLPTWLRLHGGPVYQHDAGFRPEAQLLAARGYAVVLPNPRGSSGRGEAFSHAIFAEWGGKDTEDVLAAADHAVATGVADPARLAVGGWSYGGILTDHVIARDPRFRAAISGAGLADALAGWGTDQYVRDYESELGTPWAHPEKWLRNAYPLLHADRIRTPTLFLHGEEDVNVPIHGSLQLYQALRALNVPTELVVYPGEAHALERPSFVRDRATRYVTWLDRWLAPAAAP
jgi:dipeptidyl aminopeptidase/acylaminoacyl peptidase